MLIMELPPYKRPLLRVMARHMWDRSRLFLRRAGTVILGINILLWFLATYPKTGNGVMEHRSDGVIEKAGTSQFSNTPTLQHSTLSGRTRRRTIRNSFAGRMGRAIEPIIAPLGFDWKIGIGIVPLCCARSIRQHHVHGL